MDGQINNLSGRADRAEKEVKRLAELLSNLSSQPSSIVGREDEVERYKAENSKLKYRIAILEKAVNSETTGHI